ncbi:MAG TPA: formate dehydrogenase subunit gamma [Actinomycetes bacterium]|nr:formate dehydrogenase subunit gamma [Actinomycetes bacterium]
MTVDAVTPSGERLDERVREIVANHRDDRGPLLPILHSVQAEFGCVSAEVIPLLATELNLSRAEVHGVASFYRDFRKEPAGETTVRICRAEACQSVGGRELASAASTQFGVEFGQTSNDGRVTLDEVFCLGNCALGPAVAINGVTHGRVDAARLAELVTEATAK